MRTVFAGRWVIVSVLIATLLGCAHTETGEYVDDSWITSKVKSEMIADKTVHASNITVNTTKGVVTLSGTAANVQESTKAVEIARSVKGVTSVENNIKVQ
jgi:osmotically-inducible protein OsmY